MSRKSTMERWLIYRAIQEGNRKSAEQSVLDNRAENIQRYNQSRTDFTGGRGLSGDYDANPMLGAFSTDTSANVGMEYRKKKQQTGAVAQ